MKRTGYLLVCALGVAAALWILAPTEARAGTSFRTGPRILGESPPDAGAPFAFVPWEAVATGTWPEGVVEDAARAAKSRGGLLLVGHTDSVGPHSLNRSLGLQYAVQAARRLSQESGVGLEKIACASGGEAADDTAGVDLHPWTPPRVEQRPAAKVAILEPAEGVPHGETLWALWEPSPGRVLWGWEHAAGGARWEVPAHGTPLTLALPAVSGRIAVGAVYAGEAVVTRAVTLPAAERVDDLTVDLEAEGPSWARLSVRVPAHYSRAALWAGGVPYPVPDGSAAGAELMVALFPGTNEVYLQAMDPIGVAVAGPTLELRGEDGQPPVVLAVLVWEGEGVDLDLHAWRGQSHTHGQDPDPAFSPRAVPGTRLLFDGNDSRRAAALWAEATQDLSIEVLCHADLSGNGARAWLYLAEHPGDPLESRYRILGPRRLSEHPLQVRWPALAGVW